MKLTALAVLFATSILFTGAIATSGVQSADALKSEGVSVSSYGSKTKSLVCGDRLCSEIQGGREAWESEQVPVNVVIPDYGLEQKGMALSGSIHNQMCNCLDDGTCSCGSDCNCADMKHGKDGMCSSCGKSGHGSHGSHKMTAHSGTLQSETDPGQGHELHQLAVLLPPSDKLYKGILTYSASENVQLVALHGPLTDDEVVGQTIWTPDGETKFALTLVDQQNKMGSWMFTGNALAAHTFNTDPFAITYSVVSMGGASASVHEKMTHEATCDCAAGCACDQAGACICSGEAGPCMCGPNCNCGE